MGDYAVLSGDQGYYYHQPSAPVYPYPSSDPLLPHPPMSRSQSLSLIIVFLLLVCLSLTLGILALGFTYWLHYCDMDFSLLHYSTGFSLQDLQSTDSFFCLFPSLTFDGCGNLCNIITLLSTFGVITLTLGIIGLTTLLLSLFLLCLYLYQPHWHFLSLTSKVTVTMSTVMLVLVPVVYGAVYGVVRWKAEKTEAEMGLVLAAVNGGLMVATQIVGFSVINRAQGSHQ